MKKLFATIFLMSLYFVCFGQTDNFLAGYVITNTGDSISGEILYKGNNTKNNICTFRHVGDRSVVKYSTDDLLMYRYYNDKCYAPLRIDVDKKEEIVFVEYLLNGIVNIYYYEPLDTYYIKNEAGETFTLKGGDEEIVKNGSVYKIPSRKYIGVLKYVFKNDLNALNDIDKGNIKLQQEDLIELGEKYHNDICTERECVVYYKDYDFVKMNETTLKLLKSTFGFFSGYDLNTIPSYEPIMYEEERYFITNIDREILQYSSPKIGLFFNYNLHSIQPRISVCYEVAYNKYFSTAGFKFTTGKMEHANRVYDFKLDLKREFITNTLSLKYNLFQSENNALYISGGYSLLSYISNSFQRFGEYTYQQGKYLNHVNLNTPKVKIKELRVEHRPLIGIGYSRRINFLYVFSDIRYQTVFSKTIDNDTFITDRNYNLVKYIGSNIMLNIGVGVHLASGK